MQAILQEQMAVAIDASCSLLDGKPAAGQPEDECHLDDETDSESDAEDDASDMDAAGPLIRPAHLKSGDAHSSLLLVPSSPHHELKVFNR